MQTLSAQERTVLRLHVLDGLGTDEIGALYKVHRTTVARWQAQAVISSWRRLGGGSPRFSSSPVANCTASCADWEAGWT